MIKKNTIKFCLYQNANILHKLHRGNLDVE